jgi:osmotically-inducible protein OsmY
MKIKRLFTALVLLFVFVASTLAASKPPDDNFIYDSVREKLSGDVTVKGAVIDVDVKDGVVTLKGIVQDSQQKSKAESLAKKVKGVKSVVNDIKITPQ